MAELFRYRNETAVIVTYGGGGAESTNPSDLRQIKNTPTYSRKSALPAISRAISDLCAFERARVLDARSQLVHILYQFVSDKLSPVES